MKGVALIKKQLGITDWMELPELLDSKTAALISNTSIKTIHDMCRAGKIKGVQLTKVWRINRDSLLEYLGLI